MFWNNLVTMAQLTDTVAIKIRFYFPLFGNNIDDKIAHGFNWNYKCSIWEITIPVMTELIWPVLFMTIIHVMSIYYITLFSVRITRIFASVTDKGLLIEYLLICLYHFCLNKNELFVVTLSNHLLKMVILQVCKSIFLM